MSLTSRRCSAVQVNSRFGHITYDIEDGNPKTVLEEADHQSLLFSARYDQYNLARLERWKKYSLKWTCLKRLSDSADLIAFVEIEQEMVVDHQMRRDINQMNLYRFPVCIKSVIFRYYKVPAIYPIPRKIKYEPPYKGFKNPWADMSWRIDDAESKRDINHILNQEDRQRDRKARADVRDGKTRVVKNF